jgi:hypothetical protein
MTWKAHVHLQESPNAPGTLCDLGIIDLEGDAQVGSHVYLSFHGTTEVGLIEHIDSGAVPAVHISLPKR